MMLEGPSNRMQSVKERRIGDDFCLGLKHLDGCRTILCREQLGEEEVGEFSSGSVRGSVLRNIL